MANNSHSENGEQVTIEVKVAGSPLPSEINILSICIEKSVNKHSIARIVVKDGDLSTENFEVSSSSLFEGGAELTIEAGYDSKHKLLFRGKITEQSIYIDKLSGSSLEIACLDSNIEYDTLSKKVADTSPVFTITYGEDLFELKADLNFKTSELIGQAKIQGSNLAELGKYFTLKGVGSKFSGDHFIAGVVHDFKEGNWLTEISLG